MLSAGMDLENDMNRKGSPEFARWLDDYSEKKMLQTVVQTNCVQRRMLEPGQCKIFFRFRWFSKKFTVKTFLINKAKILAKSSSKKFRTSSTL